MKSNIRNGFTLVELLAVLVILAVILVIAVPKVMSIIKDVRISTLESTAKLVALSAEKKKVENEIIGNNEVLTCENVVKINDIDYENCYIEFIDNKAVVTIIGKGTFKGMNACEATKTNANITERCLNKKVEVTLELNGGSATDITGIYKEGTIIDLEEPVKENSTFTSYKIVSGNSVISNNKLTVGSTNTIIHAMYESWPSLEIDLDGGSDTVNYKEVYKSGSIIELEKPTKEGYIFRGWQIIEGNGIISGNTFTMGSERTVIEAIWEGPMTDNIYIINAEYLESENLNFNESKINNIYESSLNGNVVLGENPNAYITYKITMYNNTNNDYMFERIKNMICQDNLTCNIYINNNIKISLDIEKGQVINAKDYLTFNITFSYANTENMNNYVFNSNINILFTEVDKIYLLKGSELNVKIKNATNVEDVDNNVTKVIFGKHSDYSNKINWDSYETFVDEEQLGNIRLYRVQENNGITVYILAKDTIYAHSNSARSFMNLRAMKEIEFNNYNTSQVLDMTRMFYMYSDVTLEYASSLKQLNLSSWDTYNVLNMRAMFGYNTELEYLNISTWETSNCNNMGYLFQEMRSLSDINITNFDTSNVTTMQGMFLGVTGVKELDLSSFDTSNVTIMTNMFDANSYHTSSEYTSELKTIYVSNKFVLDNIIDKSNKMFDGNINLVGGNGTKYSDNKTDVNYAVIDSAIYDVNGNYISGEPGYFTLK